MLMKNFLSLIFLAIIFSCFVPNKSNKDNNNTEQVSKGIIIFSPLDLIYFFPFADTSTNLKDYQKAVLKDGFLVTLISRTSLVDLRLNYSDTLVDEANSPFTNIVPVSIKYHLVSNLISSENDTICLSLNYRTQCLSADRKTRLIKSIVPLKPMNRK